MYWLLILGICVSICEMGTAAKVNDKNPKYSNMWVAKVRGGDHVAKRIAMNLGFTYNGQLGQFKNYYKFVREDHPEVSLRDSDHLTDSLLDFDEVLWAKQQMLVRPVTHGLGFLKKKITKTEDIMSFLKEEARKYGSSVTDSCISLFSCIIAIPTNIRTYLMSLDQGDIRKLGTFSTKPAPKSQLNEYSSKKTAPIGLVSKKISAYALTYNDPFWRKQWNMQDYRTVDMPVMDLNVVPVHKKGITGKGVTVAVVDTGVDHDCPELKENILADQSFDVCEDADGSHPKEDSHGTNSAGVIAMKPNNNLCGVGIAYNASIVGIKALCKDEQGEHVTAQALMHYHEGIDIYTISWGLGGEGLHVFTLDHLTKEALIEGTTKGRNNKGIIYIRSSGNDRLKGDNCAVDGELNNEFFIVIAGAQQFGKPVYYSERCTAVFATAYTQSIFKEGIVAPNRNGGCYSGFTGTSAACSQAAGVIALALEANPDLTYRDVMHLITMSAEVAPLADNDKIWKKNGRGFWVSNAFGFGLMNAENMVNLALNWQNVPKKSVCVETVSIDKLMSLSYGSPVSLHLPTSACKGSPNEVNYLEHVELASNVSYPFRGHITVYLLSPEGTFSQLLGTRYKDSDASGLEGWSIMSTHNWGENPHGDWFIIYKISNKGRYLESGYVKGFTIKFHGTKDMPAHYEKNREYAAFRLPNGKTSE